MKKEPINATALAIAAVSIALAGSAPPAKSATSTAKVQCLGVNSCKAKSDCHTPKNSCKGANSCKGQGWLYQESAKACEEAGGKVLD
jgi:hypothetical protein